MGTVIYFKVDQNGVILYGVDGENAGVFMKDVDIAGQLWVMLEAYGSVQAFRFVGKSFRRYYKHFIVHFEMLMPLRMLIFQTRIWSYNIAAVVTTLM